MPRVHFGINALSMACDQGIDVLSEAHQKKCINSEMHSHNHLPRRPTFFLRALESTHRPWSQAIESALILKCTLGTVDCRVKYVLERKGVKEQDGLTDLMKFRIW